MKIDLHIHSRNSDGKLSVKEILKEAKNRNIDFLSITDHDCICCQDQAFEMAKKEGVKYITGVELNVTFSHPKYHDGKAVSLDFLGYQFDPTNNALESKLDKMAKHRDKRAARILDNLNTEFKEEHIAKLTNYDLKRIEESVDGVLGRPHIADYLIKKGIVKTRQEAFDKYLVKCDVQKFPLHLEEASKIIRDAGGKIVLAHPNDPHGTSLTSLTKVLVEETEIIKEKMFPYIDGVECWHLRNTIETTNHYMKFALEQELIMTGGSDCHQKPIVMGTAQIPDWVADQFAKT
jgi:predicted metal-dependent phosphoesterase TrpH